MHLVKVHNKQELKKLFFVIFKKYLFLVNVHKVFHPFSGSINTHFLYFSL